VRTKFRIDDADLSVLQDLIVSSGLRWAWDADDRAHHDQPAVDQNTVRFALERLAPAGLDVVPHVRAVQTVVAVQRLGADGVAGDTAGGGASGAAG
jgi:hypothetical protein